MDAHVHLHPNFDPDEFFSHADRNFRRAANGVFSLDRPPARVLLLADPGGWNTFERLLHERGPATPKWSVAPTDEVTTLVARMEGSDPLWLIRGRQIAARERLEVLALGTATHFEDGIPFAELVDRSLQAEAITVIPWGFGKWSGRRGQIVRTAIERARIWNLFVGDNGGRLLGTRTPSLIRSATARGIFNLPGSDPLPFEGQVRHPGRCGVLLPGTMNPQFPTREIRAILRGLSGQPETYGRGTPLPQFVLSQARMQLRGIHGRA